MRIHMQRFFVRLILSVIALIFLLQCRGAQAGVAEPITFTGPTTFGTPTVTTTTETPSVTIVAPGLIFPELTPEGKTDLSDGFAISGRFDFLNGSGTAAELTFTASRPVSLASGTLFTSSSIDGDFGILSGDVGSGSTPAISAHLDSITETTMVQTLGASTATASDMNETIPVTVGFPNDAYHSLAGPAIGGPFSASGSFLLVQSVDIKISGLLPGETVDIGLPTTSTIDVTPVPEPGSAGLLVAGLMMCRVSRKRTSRSSKTES